ncbi:Protein of unknown function [Brevibacterium siliguriense]|uniref:DUF1648 domain-containing protein n=1 Tax=Brevibacterium siliguriense TaxID=1136497 RepID=A0A1H1XY21_9MICO|nr:DUF1648 domain-containing protein [Brevibacterium siliguriense]SDT14092.1 Protein of unknown function [Brevibacterium siliguriense]
MASTSSPRSNRWAATAAGALLAVLVVTILWFAAYAPETVPSHIGIDGTIDGRSSKSGLLFVVGPLALLISGGLLLAPLHEAIPLHAWPAPFVFNGAFWIAEDRTDFLRKEMIEYLHILSGLSSALFSSALWMSWFESTGRTVPSTIPPMVFASLAALLAAATVRHYLRLRPSEWSPDESTESD